MVNVKIPEGTVLDGTHYTNPNWFGGNPYPGKAIEQVTWITPEAVAPGEVVSFEMTVSVLSEMAGQQLIMEGYNVMVGSSALIVSGPPINIPILTVAPIPTVTPLPTETATTIPSLIPASSADTATPDEPIPGNTATPISPEEIQATVTSQTPSSTATLVIVVIGFSVFAALSAGLIWFLRRL